MGTFGFTLAMDVRVEASVFIIDALHLLILVPEEKVSVFHLKAFKILVLVVIQSLL